MLQIFLLFDVFIMGALAMTAFRHARAHFRPDHDLDKARNTQNGHLPASVREKMLEEAEAHFRLVLNRAANEMGHDLQVTTSDIKKQLERQGSEVVSKELERYHAKLAELEDQTEGVVGGMTKDVAQHQAELRAKAAAEVEAEKQRLLQQIDTKLADAVGSFLIETLQHNVDLGAQTAYLTTMLEEHKADIAKGVSGETQAGR